MIFTCTCTPGCRTATRVSVSAVSSDHEIISLESTGSEGGGAGGGASPGNTVRPQNISLSSLLESVLLALEEPKGIQYTPVYFCIFQYISVHRAVQRVKSIRDSTNETTDCFKST